MFLFNIKVYFIQVGGDKNKINAGFPWKVMSFSAGVVSLSTPTVEQCACGCLRDYASSFWLDFNAGLNELCRVRGDTLFIICCFPSGLQAKGSCRLFN